MGLMINPAPTLTLNNGDIASEGKLHFFENGSTSIRKPVYIDPELNNQLNNPLTLTDAGRLPTCFGTGTYTIVLESADEVQQWVRNDIAIDDMSGQFADYSSVKIYLANEIVRYVDGNYYFSLKNNNRGNTPSVNSEWWSQIGFLEFFNESKASENGYKINDIVISGGFLYRSLEDNNGDTPPSPKWANLTFNDSVDGNFSVGGDLSVSGTMAVGGDIATEGVVIVGDAVGATTYLNNEGQVSSDGTNYFGIVTDEGDMPEITLSLYAAYTHVAGYPLKARVNRGMLYVYGAVNCESAVNTIADIPSGYRPIRAIMPAVYRTVVTPAVPDDATSVVIGGGSPGANRIDWNSPVTGKQLFINIVLPIF